MVSLNIRQIAVASDAENGESLYALTEDGVLYVLFSGRVSPHDCQSPVVSWWERVDYPVGDPRLNPPIKT